MYIVIEEVSYVGSNEDIVKEGVTARSLICDSIQEARDLAMKLARIWGTRDDGEMISDYECSYMSCGYRNFLKFSVAKLEVVE